MKSGKLFESSFVESELVSEFYTSAQLDTAAGRVACVVIDYNWRLEGSEAIAETFFSVMRNQRRDGGQHEDSSEATQSLTTLLHPAQCPTSVNKISSEYLEQKHRVRLLRQKMWCK